MEKFKIIRYFFLILLAFSLSEMLGSKISAGAPGKKKKILVLNSYHQGFEWSDKIVEGISHSFEKFADSYELIYETMDAKRYSSETYLELYRKILIEKFQSEQIELVIASDNHALTFLNKNMKDFLGSDVPVVFCGVNDFDFKMVDALPRVTGVEENLDFLKTLKLALKWFPKTENVYIVHDKTFSGLYTLNHVAEDFDKLPSDLKIFQRSPGSFAELIALLKNIPQNSILLPLHYIRMRDGSILTKKASIQLITTNAKVPVFSLFANELGFGVIGGKVISGFFQGQAAAEKALEILDGQDISLVPIQKESPNTFMFDYRVLKKWKIESNELPNDSILIHTEVDFLENHKEIIILGFIVFISLLILAIILSVEIYRRNLLEKQLIRSEEKWKSFALNSPDNILATDKNLDVTFCHRADPEFFPSLIKGNSLVDFSEFGMDLKKKLEDTKVSELHFRKKIEVPSYQGKSTVFEISVAPIFLGKKMDGLVIVARDVTQTHELFEKVNEAKSKAEEANLAKDVFLAHVSHELRTPLTSIMGYTDLLMQGVLGELSESQLKAVNTVQRSGKSLLSLVNDLLDITLIESGKMLIEKGAFSMKVLVEPLNANFAEKAKESGIEFRIHLQDAEIWADKEKLLQTLNNLINNALKFTESGGVVTVMGKITDERVVIFVRDTGIGIPRNKLKLVFDRFHRGNPVSNEPGFGLGLEIAQKIAKLHGGGISVESEVGKGSCFTVSLPLN